ncbi:hypothetical protein OsI_01451 [Oryza sativa Indica Group]|uniref:Uncharacterized protein n=1 Tax=Oryza sativa subsp. indica TaxID=39946 RepID=B8ACN3_ORYSI|nr:hypothetical protein OsI_01451 [Oryza sativa Indica Group]
MSPAAPDAIVDSPSAHSLALPSSASASTPSSTAPATPDCHRRRVFLLPISLSSTSLPLVFPISLPSTSRCLASLPATAAGLLPITVQPLESPAPDNVTPHCLPSLLDLSSCCRIVGAGPLRRNPAPSNSRSPRRGRRLPRSSDIEKGKEVQNKAPRTMDALFAQMKQQRMRTIPQQQTNTAPGRQIAQQQRNQQQRRGRGYGGRNGGNQ